MVISNFIPPYKIEESAKAFLKQYHPENSIPIPIEEIVEIKLNFKIIPSRDLRRDFGIDAFSIPEHKEIYIDEHQYFDMENRARFTLAHEVGHLILHNEFTEAVNFSDFDQWKKFVLKDLKGSTFLEPQANMFASFLLLPTSHLENQYKVAKENLKNMPDLSSEQFNQLLDKDLYPYLAKPISKVFEVSEQCCELRLKNWLNSLGNNY